MFAHEYRGDGGKWRVSRFTRYDFLDDAIAAAVELDEHGNDVRVRDLSSGFVVWQSGKGLVTP